MSSMNNDMPFIIAIDGPAASGKGSLAKKIAQHYEYDFLDTGALYRRVAKKVIDQNIDPNNENAVSDAAEQLKSQITDDYDDNDLRNDSVGSMASVIAQNQDVRHILFDSQRNFAKNAQKGAVLDGRDIGTVIYPEAQIKLFVTASTEERAKRRLKELHLRGKMVTSAQVLAEMQERDDRDSPRLDQHLAPDHSVEIIDTTDLSPDEVFQKAIEIIESSRS
ncbi:MAG: (d)CMP kinase [Pseudomonadota bacterium]